MAKHDGAAGVRKATTAADGTLLEYEVVGTGDPLVLLHGAFTGRGAWSRQRALAERFRLILPSARAHDGSGRELPADYGIATSDVRDLVAVIEAEGLERFDVMGHSSGGATAFAFARAYPAAVRRLVLIEPTLLALLPPDAMQTMQREWGRLVQIARTEGDAVGLAVAIAWLGRDGWARLEEGRKAKMLEGMASLAHITGPHFQALLDFAVTEDDVRRLAASTQLVYGSASFPFEDLIAQRLQQLRPEWPLLTIDGGSHNCFREQPDLVNATVVEFLSQA